MMREMGYDRNTVVKVNGYVAVPPPPTGRRSRGC